MANIKADEITKILREQIENYQQTVAVDEVGSVISVGDGIARVHGLDRCMSGEMLEFPHGVFGIALNLEEDQVGTVLLGDYTQIREGDTVKRTNRIMSVPVGEGMIGRVVDPLGQPLDGKGPVQTDHRNPLERIAPGVVDRQPVREPVQTGIKAIDSMIPIGRGQRELIIGDRQTGKTAIILDTILNQRGGDMICIYCAIGQKRSTVAQVVKTLTDHGAMEYSIVVAATASEPATMQYIAPFAAAAMGEYFRDISAGLQGSPAQSKSSCRWPPESFTPRSPTMVAKPSGNRIANSSTRAISQARSNCSSVASGRENITFSRIVPSNRNVSCNTTPSCCR